MKYLSDAFVTKVTNAVVREFQKQSTYLLSDDAGLKSCWDEICVITQEGGSFVDEVNDAVAGVVTEKINKQKPDSFSLCAVWLQTDSGADWQEAQVGTENIEPTYNMDDVVAYITEEILGKAMNWSNKRIERYSDSQYELDDEY